MSSFEPLALCQCACCVQQLTPSETVGPHLLLLCVMASMAFACGAPMYQVMSPNMPCLIQKNMSNMGEVNLPNCHGAGFCPVGSMDMNVHPGMHVAPTNNGMAPMAVFMDLQGNIITNPACLASLFVLRSGRLACRSCCCTGLPWREGPTAAQDDEHAHESHERDPEPVRWLLVEPAEGLVRV